MSICDHAPSLSRLLDGELQPAERVEVEAHLTACGQCRATQAAFRAEGEALRGFFRRHALGDDFVEKVRRAAVEPAIAPAARAALVPRRGARRWLPLAAAIAAGVFATTILYRSLGDQALARVLSPGDRLEVRAARAPAWRATRAGAVLRQGDWLRTAAPGGAELLFHDASRITLGGGTLAQLGSGSPQLGLALLAGAVRSDGGTGSSGVAVRTAAGTVTGSATANAGPHGGASTASRFEVTVRSLVLPELQIARDRGELWSGKVQVVGGVVVEAGSVDVSSGPIRRTIAAGGGAFFTPTHLAAAPSSAGAQRVEARLEKADAGGSARLTAALTSGDQGLRIEVRIQAFPLARLLEWVADASVEGAPDFSLTGNLIYPVDAEPGDVTRAIADDLGLEVTLRSETASLPAASLTQRAIEASPSERAYTLRRSESGTVSFRFSGIPAGEVLRALRRVHVGVPYPASGSEWVPVDLEANDLDPAAVPAWLERTLGVVRSREELTLRVAEVRTAMSATEASSGEHRMDRVENARPAGEKREGSASTRSTHDGERGSVLSTSGPVATVVEARSSARGAVWGVLGQRPTAAAVGGGVTRHALGQPAALHGRLLSGDEERIVRSLRSSRRLVWPAATGDARDAALYYLHNPADLTAALAWNGYDASGRLVARFRTSIAASTGVRIDAGRDLGVVLERGGHWETDSDLPVSAAIGYAGAGATFYPFDGERLPSQWELDAFDVEGIGGDSAVWIVNPSPVATRVVIALVEKGATRALASAEMVVAGHGAALWSAAGLGLSSSEIERLRRSGDVLIESRDGPIASSIGGRGIALEGTDGEWVTSAPVKR